ncbi:(Fe-S)-binding protein [Chryseolinea sp. T2]|uniref:(Fe-S)-binding protein n=1 Tax=Chryseolinea sp. T2 TaxID=3129255 RepID=UPI0030770313
MKVALFVPCYVDQFYPQVGIATLQLLEKLGVTVSVPENQTCCGQPMANSGFAYLSHGCDENFVDSFANFDYVVCPSGSCTLHIKDHLRAEGREDESSQIRGHIKELTEFITDVLQVKELNAKFPHKVGLHQSCHGQRGLGLSQMSEVVAPPFSKPEQLLRMVEGIQLIELDRRDECCGFGGTFCVTEEAVSVKMGIDRVADHIKHGAEYITAGDMSCLMHLEGILRRQKSKTQVIHIAQILNATTR